MPERKLILFIAVSLDGFIARADGDIDWLSIVESPGEDYGYSNFIQAVDTVIMGRKSYEKVLSFGIEFPHAGRKCYVLTRTERPADSNAEFYSGDIGSLVKSLKQSEGRNIFVDGGAEVVSELMKRDLIDEYIISIIPIFLGRGISLYKGDGSEMRLQLRSSKQFKSGLVQLSYARPR